MLKLKKWFVCFLSLVQIFTHFGQSSGPVLSTSASQVSDLGLESWQQPPDIEFAFSPHVHIGLFSKYSAFLLHSENMHVRFIKQVENDFQSIVLYCILPLLMFYAMPKLH